MTTVDEQIIYRDFGLKGFSFTNKLAVVAIVSFSYIHISQRSIATPIRCGGIFTNHFIANFPASARERILKIG